MKNIAVAGLLLIALASCTLPSAESKKEKNADKANENCSELSIIKYFNSESIGRSSYVDYRIANIVGHTYCDDLISGNTGYILSGLIAPNGLKIRVYAPNEFSFFVLSATDKNFFRDKYINSPNRHYKSHFDYSAIFNKKNEKLARGYPNIYKDFFMEDGEAYIGSDGFFMKKRPERPLEGTNIFWDNGPEVTFLAFSNKNGENKLFCIDSNFYPEDDGVVNKEARDVLSDCIEDIL